MTFVDVPTPGDADALRLTQGPIPQPATGEVLVRVQAAGINRPDILQRQGKYPPPPGASPILGLEIAGEVVATGENVTWPRVGERVCALTNGGGYAEYCTVPAPQCLPWPRGFDAVKAAALPETYFTVWANLFEIGRLRAGEIVLIHGGTSGIGVTAIQLATEFGARAFATAGSDDKCAVCRRLGAAEAINYRTSDFEAEIARLTHGAGVQAILDIVGAAYFNKNINCLAPDGRLLLLGLLKGAVVEQFNLSLIMRRRVWVTGSTLRPRSTAEKGALAAALREKVWPILEQGHCLPQVERVYPLAEVADAHRYLESGVHIGKVVLSIARD